MTAARQRKAVRHAGGDDKEVAGARGVPAFRDQLHPLARQVKDQLRVRVPVRRHLGLTVEVELEFVQHQAQGVNLDFLDKNGVPCAHGGKG